MGAHMHTHTHTYRQAQTNDTHSWTHTYMNPHMHAHTHTHTCTYTDTHTQIHTFTHKCIHVRMHTCTDPHSCTHLVCVQPSILDSFIQFTKQLICTEHVFMPQATFLLLWDIVQLLHYIHHMTWNIIIYANYVCSLCSVTKAIYKFVAILVTK